MRTKTLLLSAALGALSGASLMAQVYSLNAVGYINVTIAPGFSQIANQLWANGQGQPTYISPTLDAQLGNSPSFTGCKLYKWSASGNAYEQFTVTATGQNNYKTLNAPTNYPEIPLSLSYSPTNTSINPGEAVWFFNKWSTNIVLTFVGTVPQTNATLTALTNTLYGPTGAGLTTPSFNLISSVVPVAGQLDTVLGMTPATGDHVFIWDTNGNGYDTYAKTAGGWSRSTAANGSVPANPTVAVGQGFWYETGKNSTATSTNWVQYFGVNQ